MSSGARTVGSRRGVIAVAAAAFAVVVVAVLVLTNSGGSGGSGASSGSGARDSSTTVSSSGAVAQSPAPSPPRGMATVALASLPAEARDVVDKLDHGGAFKYRQDGTTFANREKRLPAQPQGYYREYTVTTPGASDRGARRLIVGRRGELYYTPDHYQSFQWVVRDGST